MAVCKTTPSHAMAPPECDHLNWPRFGLPGFPSNRGDFLIAGSCNFAASSDYRTPVQSVPRHSLVRRGHGGHRTRHARGWAGWACPYFLPGGPQWSPGSRPARRAVAVGDAPQPGGRRGGPVPLRGASPSPGAAAELSKVSGGKAASFWVWAAQRPAPGHAASFPASARS